MRAALLKVVGAAVVASMLVAVPKPAAAAEPRFSETADAMAMTNGVGRVLAIATGGNRTFLGGSFTGMRETFDGSTIGQQYLASVDLWTGAFRAGFAPVVNDEVRAVALSPDGQTLYIGGRFTMVNGETRRKIAALDATTGELKAGFAADIESSNVDSMVVTAGGDLFVGGSFNRVNGSNQRALARIDGLTGALENFDAAITTGRVTSLLLSPDGERLYVGTLVNDERGRPRDGGLIAVDPGTGNRVAGFNASGVTDPVLDIALSKNKIYLALGGGGGEAQVLNMSDGSRRARFVTDGDVQAVEVIGDRAYFAGHWVENFGATDSFHFTAVDTLTDDIDDSYYPRLNGTHGLHDLHYDGYHFWMGGEVTGASPVPRLGFARYSPLGSSPTLSRLVGARARWKYLDDGSQPGSGWRTLGYDDGNWATGKAELGFGDGDEKTVIDGGPAADRHITSYFRRTVTIYEHKEIGYLEIRLKRDDGAVVYINGIEVIRDNMPSGTITGATRASSSTNGAAEDAFSRWLISPQVLVEGDNLVAVEVHQDSPTSDDASFDMRMLVDTTPATFIDAGASWSYRDDGPSLARQWRRLGYDDSQWKVGAAQLGYGDGDEVTVIDPGPDGARHITTYFRRVFTVYDLQAVSKLELELLRDDGAVVYLNRVEVVRSNMPAGAVDAKTVAASRSRKSDESKWHRYSIDPALLQVGDNILAVEIHQRSEKSDDHSFDLRLSVEASPEVLIKKHRKWRYDDSGTDRGIAWRELAYGEHSKWDRGRAELGYGDGDEATVVDSGPPGDRHPAVYFRRWFRVTDPAVFDEMIIRLVRDDGAVVYVNGVEVVRTNMPGGTITFDTLASASTPDENLFHTFTVPGSMLRAGKNVIAVEVHQSGPGSSDLSFDLKLTAR